MRAPVAVLSTVLVLSLAFGGCGRSLFGDLSAQDFDGALTGGDGPPGRDIGSQDSGEFDTGPRRDGGRRPDAGQACNNDCECPLQEACLGGACMIANRNNLCCTNPFCPPGQFCIEPGGQPSMCTGVGDGGVFDVGMKCFNDCDCPPFEGCMGNTCVQIASMRPNLCCFDRPCPPGEFCELPGGGSGVCSSPGDGGPPDVGQNCFNDCDCPPFEGCINGFCNPNGNPRPNLCCFDQPCPPGQFCELPGGMTSSCPSPIPDAGSRDAFVLDATMGCFTDCDCVQLGEVCVNGSCIAAMRQNQCCFGPFCPPGQSCVLPNGQGGVCAGTDGGPPPFDGGISCNTDCDCPFNGQGCIGGLCQPVGRPNACCLNPQCPPGAQCVFPNGQPSLCPGPFDGGVMDASIPNVPVGAPCMGSMQCAGFPGFCIDPSQGFPGGYCSMDCSQFMCPNHSSCFDVGMANRICLEDCMMPTDCRQGYDCVRLGLNPQPVCWPIPPASMNPNGAPVGSACMMDSDCVSGLQCLQLPGGGFPGGYCTKTYCDPATNPCPASSQCYAFPGLFSLCLADCPNGGSQSTCRAGYYCLGPTGQPGVCVNM